MLEIDIHDFYIKNDLSLYFNSIANTGDPDIAANTWCRALNHEPKLLTPEQIPLARRYFGEMVGEWGNLSDDEIQGLFVQHVSAEILEFRSCADYEDYESQTHEGQVSGNIFFHEGRMWISLE